MAELHVLAFLGPSMPVAEARRVLAAQYRPPIRRGDLRHVTPGTVVAMIDGVFEQDLAVSPREVHDAISAGVIVIGGASMGALRAAEVPGVMGVGRVFDWYSNGIITRDDEVALLFDPFTCLALTVPTVNVRFAVDQLCRSGTINKALGDALIAAALAIPYKERTYEAILTAAGVRDRPDSEGLIEMLAAHDIKRQDAQAVLEAADRHRSAGPSNASNRVRISGTAIQCDHAQRSHGQGGPRRDEVLVWESGDRLTHRELREFLIATGVFEKHARAALPALHLNPDVLERASQRVTRSDAQSAFNMMARRWGWGTSHEAKETLADLGLDLEEMARYFVEQTKLTRLVEIISHEAPDALERALCTELFSNDLALKREAMRLGALQRLAECSVGEVTSAELNAARAALSRINSAFSFTTVRQRWAELGFDDNGRHEAFIEQIARARRTATKLVSGMRGQSVATRGKAFSEATIPGLELASCVKPTGESRFCLSLADAEQHARRLAKLIGITRVGMIGELADLGGVQIAQAARPGNSWSSSYGGGKGRSPEGAVVGSVMEELEKWSQEQFQPTDGLIEGSYLDQRDDRPVIDPATLDLPFDTVYRSDMSLRWYPCHDLLTVKRTYIPVDVLQIARSKHDICFTQRGARKHLATNGLASGFRLEEAILHAVCEYVERHAQRLAELQRTNPGQIGSLPYHFVDLATTSPVVRDLVNRLSQRTATVKVLDITSEIRIPTFHATVTREYWSAEGFAAHPDPNVAIEMALLEAAQAIATVTAGGREDMSIRVRSLGRHERPRPICPRDIWFWLDPDTLHTPLDLAAGFISADVYEELNWCLDRIHHAGVQHVLIADLTPPEITPAKVVRAIIPGLETNNPFYMGPRARLLLLRDLLPHWQ